MAFDTLPVFENEGRFVVSRPFLFRGTPLQKGDSVAGIPPRRLRQLYDRRMVAYAAAPNSPGTAGKKGKNV